MKIKIPLFMVFAISVFVNANVFAQTPSKQQPLSRVTYNANVNDPLTTKELSQIQEVYGDTAQENVLDIPQRVKDIKNILRNRVEIYDAGDKDLSSLPKLSQVPLFNDFVPTLNKNAVFNPESFNPLKYKFDFYSRNSGIYHVDNTGYYILIKSQHQ